MQNVRAEKNNCYMITELQLNYEIQKMVLNCPQGGWQALPPSHHPGASCWCLSPDSETRSRPFRNTPTLTQLYRSVYQRGHSLPSTPLTCLLSAGLCRWPTLSFCASPRTLSSSVMESTKPWKWWLHIFSISRSWLRIRPSSLSIKRPCSCPSYTDLSQKDRSR